LTMLLSLDPGDAAGVTVDALGRDPHFPDLDVVRYGIDYGFFYELEGTYYSIPSTAAKVRAYDKRDNQFATVHVYDSPSPASINHVYVARFLQSGMQQLGPQRWIQVGVVTGDGVFDIPLSPLVEYQVKVESDTFGTTGTTVGNTFWITDFSSRRRLLIRDRVAKAAIRVAQRFGRRIWYKNPGQEHIALWAISEGGFESLGLLGGETSATRFTLWIPRQTGFPPEEGLMTGATTWVENIPYALKMSYDAELPYYAPVFRADCERYDVTVELDGIDLPPTP